MNPIVVTQDLAAKGMRVVRGPSWEWGEQDGGKGGIGTIMEDAIEDHSEEGEWVAVQWDSGSIFYYRVGAEGRHDLVMYDPFTSAGMNLTNPNARRVIEANKALQDLSNSIKKADSLIEKSNTKHGNSNTNNTDKRGPIKVRPVTSTIKGSKRRIYSPIASRRG